MPVEFLSQEQRERYGRFVEEPTSMQLAQYFHLDDRDRQFVGLRRGNHNRLGFALQLGTLRFLGTFFDDLTNVPHSVVEYVAQQLAIFDLSCLEEYHPRIVWKHTVAITQQYGYQSFSEQPEYWRLLRWMYYRAWMSDESPSVLFDQATAYLVDRKILLPGVTTLERLVATVREQVQQRLWKRLAQLPTHEQRQQLEALLVVGTNRSLTPLEELRRSPTRYSVPALVEALRRLIQIRQLGVNTLNFGKIPPSRLKALARTALSQRVRMIARMPDARRMAVLVAFAQMIEATAQDDVLDVLELRVKELLAKSERDGKQARLRTLKDLDTTALQLSQASRVLMDETLDERENLRDRVRTNQSTKISCRDRDCGRISSSARRSILSRGISPLGTSSPVSAVIVGYGSI